MTGPEQIAAAIHAAEEYLASRLEALGAKDPQAAAHDYVSWLRRQGWRPVFAFAVPDNGARWVPPPRDLIDETRAHLRANRPAEGDTDD